MDRQVGQRIHKMIGQLAGTRPSTQELIVAVHAMFRADPCGGTTEYSSRLRCVTAVSVYMARCQPSDAWNLTGVETPMGAGVADLVWTRADGRTLIDEIKSGRPNPDTDRHLTEQLTRLALGGQEQFGDQFAGVRLVPLSSPGRTTVYNTVDGRLVGVATPEGGEIR